MPKLSTTADLRQCARLSWPLAWHKLSPTFTMVQKEGEVLWMSGCRKGPAGCGDVATPAVSTRAAPQMVVSPEAGSPGQCPLQARQALLGHPGLLLSSQAQGSHPRTP